MSKRKDRWIGSAQVLVDDNGWSRAVLIHETETSYTLVGPLGATMPLQERSNPSKQKLKRLIEKELHDAGY